MIPIADSTVADSTVADLTVQPGVRAPGLTPPRPQLSWTLRTEDPDWRQAGVDVRYTAVDHLGGEGEPETVRVDTGEQVAVGWPFSPMESRDRGAVEVRVVGADASTSDFSPPVPVEVGLLHASDWQARFIAASSFGGPQDCAPILFGAVDLGPDVAQARLYVTALGTYDFRVNGHRVGAEVLAPGWTTYDHRLRYQSFDVSDLLRTGTNELQAVLGNGWFRGQLGWNGQRDIYGDRLALLAQLEVTYRDGRRQTVVTDDRWRAGQSGIHSDDLYDGQRTDLRIDSSVVGRDSEPVTVLDRDLDTLTAAAGPPVRITEILDAVELSRSPSGRILVDFGQNLVGWVRLRIRGTAGAEITVRHAEVLEHGELGVRPLRKAKATDTYLLTGSDDVCEPRFTFHGFRYAEISGTDDLTPDQIQAVVIGSDLTRTGWFSCSDPDLNQLHANVVWGMRGNFVDVPTDCPQRDERLGWTGDIQVFSPTAGYLYDTAGFLGSWLEDLAADQLPDGSVPYVIPDCLRTPDSPAAAAWGDAATVVPWVLYEQFGDAAVVARQYPSMRAWVDKMVALSGAAGTDTDGLWVGGFQFGDWLDPTAPPEDAARAQADLDVVATAHLIRSARILSEAAALIGRSDDAEHYRAVAERSRAAFNREYVTPAGRILSDCQTVYGMALVWDLLETPEQRVHAAGRLADLVRAANFRVSTGFVGTPLVLDALSDHGHEQLAVRMLQEKGCPSWLYPVTMGATTIWERWDAMLPDGSINPGEMTSFNHYALGAVADWMHRRLAGLAPIEPGWRRVRIEPIPALGLSWCETLHTSPYGPISVRWDIDGDTFTLTATIPPGVTAEVHRPGAGEAIVVGHGTHRWTDALPPRSVADLSGRSVPQIGDVLPHDHATTTTDLGSELSTAEPRGSRS